MKSFIKFLLERTGGISKGCSMLYFDLPEMSKIHSKIDEEDLYTEEEGFGLEDEPHVTLLYGFDDSKVEANAVNSAILEMDLPKEIILHNPSLFENEKYDVLKFDVKDQSQLEEINDMLTSKFPYENDYPDYHAHSTIGYLKSGKGKKYVKLFEGVELVAVPNELVYSSPDREKTKVKI